MVHDQIFDSPGPGFDWFLDWIILPSFRAAKLAPEQKSTIGRGGLGFGLASTPLGGIAIIPTNQI